MCLAQGHDTVVPVRWNPWPLGLKSSTLQLSHCATSGPDGSDKSYSMKFKVHEDKIKEGAATQEHIYYDHIAPRVAKT